MWLNQQSVTLSPFGFLGSIPSIPTKCYLKTKATHTDKPVRGTSRVMKRLVKSFCDTSITGYKLGM